MSNTCANLFCKKGELLDMLSVTACDRQLILAKHHQHRQSGWFGAFQLPDFFCPLIDLILSEATLPHSDNIRQNRAIFLRKIGMQARLVAPSKHQSRQSRKCHHPAIHP